MFGILQDDWLVIYYMKDGHQSVRLTELWPEWGLIGTDREPKNARQSGYFARRQQDVLRRAIAIGPAKHDPHYCMTCQGDTIE